MDALADPVGQAIDRTALDGAASPPTVVLGHSFGGYTILGLGGATWDEAALACPDATTDFCTGMTSDAADLFRAGFRDPRVLALVPMAPGDYDLYASGLGEVAVRAEIPGPGAIGAERQPGFTGPHLSGLQTDRRTRGIVAGEAARRAPGVVFSLGQRSDQRLDLGTGH